MNQVQYILSLAFLTLSLLGSGLGDSLGSESPLHQVGVINTEEPTTEAEHAPAPSEWRHPLKSIVKRRPQTSVLACGLLNPIMHSCDQASGRSYKSSTAVVYQAIPLYQSLQVYRF